MAQSILLKRSSVAGNVPDSSDLSLGEIAINTADGAVYIKKGNNDIVAVHDNDILHIDTSNSRVGIGKTNPNYTLDVNGGVNIASGNVLRWGSGDVEIINSSYNLLFKTYDGSSSLVEHMRITSAGNVGIGTSSPQNNLHVNAGTGGGVTLEANANVDIDFRYRSGGVNKYNVAYDASEGSLIWYDNVANAHRMALSSAGNFGIGTSAPATKLHVANGSDTSDAVRISGGHASRYLAIRSFQNNSLDGAGFILNASSSAGAFKFQTTSTDRMTIANDGNVGIGDTSPSSKLHVVGSVLNNSVQDYGIAAFENTDLEGLSIGYDADGGHTYLYSREVGVSSRGLRLNGAIYISSYDGNVGIGTGTNSLTNKLQVDGFAAIYDGLRLGSAGSGEGIFRHNPGTGNQGIGITTGSLNSSGIRLFVQHPTDGGGVGIGTTSPGALLDLSGATASSTPKLRFTGTGNASAGDAVGQIDFYNSDDTDNTPGVMASIKAIAGPSGGEGHLQFLTDMPSEGTAAATVALHLHSDGNTVFGGTSVGAAGAMSVKVDGTYTDLYLYGAGTSQGGRIFFGDSSDRSSIIGTYGTGGGGKLTFKTDTTGGTSLNRLVIDSDGSIRFNDAYTFPTSDGSANQVLQTDGSGNLSFATVTSGGGSTDSITDADGDTKIQVEENTDEDKIRFDAAGTERMRIGSDVQIIGTTDFNITGSSRRLSFTVGTGTVRTTTANSLILATNSTTALTIDSSQNATFAGNVKPYLLELEDINGSVDSLFRVYGWDNELQFTKRNLSTGAHTGTLLALNYSDNSATFLGTISSGAITSNFSSSHTTGTISHTNAALDLYNTLEADTDEKGSILTFSDNYYDGSYNKTTRAAIKGGTDTTGNTANGFLAFYTDSGAANTANERMRIDSSGNVGINSTNPGYKLDVGGSVRFAGSASIVGTLQSYSGAFYVKNIAQDQDIIFQGNDGGSTITALTLDMSNSGAATFNAAVIAPSTYSQNFYVVSSGTTVTNRIDNDGTYMYISYGGGSSRAIQVHNTTGDVRLSYGASTKLTTFDSGVDITGELQSDSLDVDGNADISGNLVLGGNLTVNGTTTTLNTATLTVDDLNITVADGAANASAADGAGITVAGALANMVYQYSNDRWTFNKEVFAQAGFMIGTTATDVGLIKNSSGVFDFQAQSGREISFSNVTNGEHVRIDADGNVGIGTNNPARELEVYRTGASVIAVKSDTGGLAQLALGDTDDDNYAQIILDNSTNKLQIQNGGGTGISNRGITLDSSENVGIGTNSPADLLHLSADSPVLRLTNTSDSGKSTIEFWDNQSGTSQAGEIFFDDGGNLFGLQGNANGIVFKASNTFPGSELMRLTSSGRLGIGTTSPSYMLDVGGGDFFVNGTNRDWGGTGGLGTHIGTGDFDIYSGVPGSGSHLLAVTNAGNLGIGDETPDFKLAVRTPAIPSGSTYAWPLDLSRPNTDNRGLTFGIAAAGTTNAIAGHNADVSIGHTYGTDSNGLPQYYETLRVKHVDQSSGYIGIGETNPVHLVEVKGTDAALIAHYYGQSRGGVAALSGQRVAFLSTSTNDDLVFGKASNPVASSGFTEYMRIDNGTGHVGIGTTSPGDVRLKIIKPTATWTGSQYTIDANGYSRFGNLRINGQDNARDIHKEDNASFGIGSNYDSDIFFYQSSSTKRLMIKAGGNVGVGNNNPSAKFQVEEYGIDTTETSSSATTQIAIHSFAAATFRSARFTVQVTNSTDSTYHTTELLLVHDGTTANITEFGEIHTGSAVEATFDCDVNSGNVRLLATPASTDTMAFKVVCHSITT